ncbi:MAG: fibronectin type III domain-containing protein, partial [Cyanobacteria bacterium MAG APA_bin_95]|nr:fibronectin type III domain-containing protein [Cyanobacteria bacterium MAG APA_bin_95]
KRRDPIKDRCVGVSAPRSDGIQRGVDRLSVLITGAMGATFTWSEPLHKGGRTLTGYRIEAREADPDSNFSRTVNVSGATTTSGEVTGPTNDTTYQGLAGVHSEGVDPSDLVRAVEL